MLLSNTEPGSLGMLGGTAESTTLVFKESVRSKWVSVVLRALRPEAHWVILLLL